MKQSTTRLSVAALLLVLTLLLSPACLVTGDEQRHVEEPEHRQQSDHDHVRGHVLNHHHEHDKRDHAALEAELKQAATEEAQKTVQEETSEDQEEEEGHEEYEFEDEEEYIESFACTLQGAQGQDACQAAADDDGSKCVWCKINTVGFCVSTEQADTAKQVLPNIACDGTTTTEEDKEGAEPAAAPGPLFDCLENKEEDACSDECTWCDTKGGFGVCLTPEAADVASESFWFECKELWDEDYEEEYDDEEEYNGSYNREAQDQYLENGPEDDDYEEDDDEDQEFVVDTSCVMAGMAQLKEGQSSEEACFNARDIMDHPCEWCSIEGSPFRLCLSEPQALVAEYVGAVCTGSEEEWEADEFDDTCISKMKQGQISSQEGCWEHQDLNGNTCEWCSLMGLNLCVGGVQAELIEHWGAQCGIDEATMKDHIIVDTQEEPKDKIEEYKLAAADDTACLLSTLHTSDNDGDHELSCAQTKDSQGNACHWCQMGTMFHMCVSEAQAQSFAGPLGVPCRPITTETMLGDTLYDDEEEYSEDEDDEEEEYESGDEGDEEDEELDDVDTSCIMAMQNGPDETSCIATKDQDGQACEWCSWNSFNVCLSSEQAEMVEPFGVSCNTVDDSEFPAEELQEHKDEMELLHHDLMACLSTTKAGYEGCAPYSGCSWCNTRMGVGFCLSNDAVEAIQEHHLFECVAPGQEVKSTQQGHQADTKCFIQGGLSRSENGCVTALDAKGEPCEWCQMGAVGVNVCMTSEQAEIVEQFGVQCTNSPLEDGELNNDGKTLEQEVAIFKSLPQDFFDCLSQSGTIDDCDESCTWCDVRGGNGAGLCLSDGAADLATDLAGTFFNCEEEETLGDIIVDAVDSTIA